VGRQDSEKFSIVNFTIYNEFSKDKFAKIISLNIDI